MIYLIISISVFASYILFIVAKFGVQKSISESYYRLTGGKSIIFTIVCMGFALPLMIVVSNGLMFLAMAGIVLAGTAGNFQESEMVNKTHMVGAVTGIVAGLINVLAFGFMYIIPVLSGAVISWFIFYYYESRRTKIIKLGKLTAKLADPEIENNAIWWAEIIAFLVIWGCIFYKEVWQ